MQLVSKQSINSSRNCSINETKTALTTHITLWQQLSFDRANQRPPIWMDDPTSKSLEDYLPPNRCQSLKFNLFYIKARHQQLKSNSVLNSKLLTGSYPRLIPWVDLDKKVPTFQKAHSHKQTPPCQHHQGLPETNIEVQFQINENKSLFEFLSSPISLVFFLQL